MVRVPESAELLDRAARQRLVDAVHPWHHSINVGEGVITPGGKTPAHHHDDIQRIKLPPLAHKSVLDIGAWDGFYTFMAEGAGAGRVVALDHYAWYTDFRAAHEYTVRQRAAGLPLEPYHLVPEAWNPEGLPGKAGFDLAHRLLNSRAEAVVGDFMTMELGPLGTFDVVLFLGVIYHLDDPVRALRRLRSVTKGVAVIETEALAVPAHEDRALWQFVEGLGDDPTSFWLPTAEGLTQMCRAAGFARADVVTGPPKRLPLLRRPERYRLVVHAAAHPRPG